MEGFKFKNKRHRPDKHFKHDNPQEKHQGGDDVVSMIKKMQQQLVFLERKIDLLLGKSSPQASRFDGQSGRHSHQTREDNSGERGFYKGKKPFGPKRRTRP